MVQATLWKREWGMCDIPLLERLLADVCKETQFLLVFMTMQGKILPLSVLPDYMSSFVALRVHKGRVFFDFGEESLYLAHLNKKKGTAEVCSAYILHKSAVCATWQARGKDGEAKDRFVRPQGRYYEIGCDAKRAFEEEKEYILNQWTEQEFKEYDIDKNDKDAVAREVHKRVRRRYRQMYNGVSKVPMSFVTVSMNETMHLLTVQQHKVTGGVSEILKRFREKEVPFSLCARGNVLTSTCETVRGVIRTGYRRIADEQEWNSFYEKVITGKYWSLDELFACTQPMIV